VFGHPTTPETGERCPDCKRPWDGEVGETCIIRGGDKCIRTERDNLRAELATLREREQLGAAVIETGLLWYEQSTDYVTTAVHADACGALLAHRQRRE